MRLLAKLLVRLLFLGALAFVAYEAYLGYGYYQDVTAATDSLERARRRAASAGAEAQEGVLLALRADIVAAGDRLARLRDRTHKDYGLKLASLVPAGERQVRGFEGLVETTGLLADSSIEAVEALRVYLRQREGGLTPAELRELEARRDGVYLRLAEAKEARAAVPDGLIAPLNRAAAELDRTIAAIEELAQEYSELLSLRR